MIGLGCLAPLILFVAGALMAHLVVGSAGVAWGGGIGFVSGLAVLAVVGWIVSKTRERWRIGAALRDPPPTGSPLKKRKRQTRGGRCGMSTWRDEKNQKARARLESRLSELFPSCVLAHALRQPLIPATQRRAVESYWRHRPLLADRMARALAARSGEPEGWQWRLGQEKASGLPMSFRMPPTPYRETAFAKGPGCCCVCGQTVYRLGWHRDLWGDGKPNRNATWHAACVVAWQFWTAPSDHIRALKLRQKRKCSATGRRLLKTAEVDHRVPLFAVWSEHRTLSWPELLAFWGAPNLQVVNKAAHLEKCAEEAIERAKRRTAAEPPSGQNAQDPPS